MRGHQSYQLGNVWCVTFQAEHRQTWLHFKVIFVILFCFCLKLIYINEWSVWAIFYLLTCILHLEPTSLVRWELLLKPSAEPCLLRSPSVSYTFRNWFKFLCRFFPFSITSYTLDSEYMLNQYFLDIWVGIQRML